MTGRRVITAIVVVVATIVVLGGLLVWKRVQFAIPHLVAGPMPDPERCRRLSELSSQAILHRMQKPGLAVGRKKHSAVPCATASTAEGAIFIRHFPTTILLILPTTISTRSMRS